MKTTIGVVVLAVVCLALGLALFSSKKQAAELHKIDTEKIVTISNQLMVADASLSEQRQVNVLLTNDLTTSRAETVKLTNKITEVAAALVKTEEALKVSMEESARREAQIKDLEKQNQDYEQRALDLSTAITNLNAQITDTKKRLAASEGDRAFLETELKRMMSEKAELERQFNDIVVLRAQVAKLREELNISRRLEWIRKGLFASSDQKGAQQLIQSGPGAAPAGTKPAHYDLNVEVNADGSVSVIPPLTNRPAATNPPSK